MIRVRLAVVLLAACATAPRPSPLEPSVPASRLPVVTNATPEGDALLRRKSQPVVAGAPRLEGLLGQLEATVRAEKGVGIAAPQVGVAERVVLVQRFDLSEKPEDAAFVAYLNPEIRERSPEDEAGWEGCLSVPAGHARVRRAVEILVAYQRPDGTRAEERVRGFTARIFQHELDHLDGVLFIDRMEPGTLVPDAEYERIRAAEKTAAAPPPEK